MSDPGFSPESGRRADPDRIVDVVERVLARYNADGDGPPLELDWSNKQDRQWVRERLEANGDVTEETPGRGGDRVGEPMLPGFGPYGKAKTAREDCGEAHPFGCPECGHVVEFGRTCAMSVCGRCGVAWIRDRAISKSAKLRRVRKVKHQATRQQEHQKLHHQVISAPLEWYGRLAMAGLTLTEVQEATREVVKAILDEQRAPGVLIRHPYRGERDDGSIADEADDRGKWKERLNSGRDFYGDVRDQLAWMPHYHCLVVSDFLKGDGFADAIEDATGWVIHRIAGEDGVSLPHDGAMARAMTYTLSHCGIELREDGHNQSQVWEVGTFEGDAIASDGRFSAHPADIDWADAVVRRHAATTLGLASSTTECGVELPAVDDPDELARQILEELYPQHEGPPPRSDLRDAVLHHVASGNISVSTSSTNGGGGSVSVTGAVDLPESRDAWATPAGGVSIATADGGADCPDCGDVHLGSHDDQDDVDGEHGRDQDDGPGECDGQLVPLGELRRRGLLEDDEWLREAPFAAEAQEADREWPDDLEPWRSSSPGYAIGAG